jgi:hypothetical protein
MKISRPDFRNVNEEIHYRDQIQNSRVLMTESLNKIRYLENLIKTFEPDFKSAINYSSYDYTRFFRAGRG